MQENKFSSLYKSNTQAMGGKSMKQSTKKLFATVSTLAIMGTTFVGGHAAFAADSSITGGTLSMTQPTIDNFAAVTLNGQVQSTTASINPFKVTDATGTGNGWNVVVNASQFTNNATGAQLPTDSLNIASPSVTAETGASDATTVNTMGGIIDNATGVKILSAALDGGMGTYDVAANTLTLNLQPKDVKAGTYTSTITVTVTTGP